jgi:hypothetical protein
VDAQHAGELQHGGDFFWVAPSFSAFLMWRRTPGPYMWVHEASTAIARNSIVFASKLRPASAPPMVHEFCLL